MLIATVAHDAGKADPGFQAYLQGESSNFSEHVDPDKIRKAVVGLATSVGFAVGPIIDDIVSEAVLHDRRMRRSRPEMTEWLRDHGGSDRWRKLADFVNHADSVASSEDVVSAEKALRDSPLRGEANLSSYQANVRGVSTTFLCVVDLELAVLSLGRPVKTMVALVPPRAIDPHSGRDLAGKLGALKMVVDRQLSPETADPNRYIALTNPAHALRGMDLAALTIQSTSSKTGEERTVKMAKFLAERLGEDGLIGLNEDRGSSFKSVEELANALATGMASETVRSDPDVIDAVQAVLGKATVAFSAITPNLVLVSLGRELGSDSDKPADKALFGFGLATMFALELGLACLVAPQFDSLATLSRREVRLLSSSA
jgi:hypothetical protein